MFSNGMTRNGQHSIHRKRKIVIKKPTFLASCRREDSLYAMPEILSSATSRLLKRSRMTVQLVGCMM